MIKSNYNEDGYLKCFNYVNTKTFLSLCIPVKSYFAINRRNKSIDDDEKIYNSTAGGIIETYRYKKFIKNESITDIDKYLNNNTWKIDSFLGLNENKNPFDSTKCEDKSTNSYDYVQIMYPCDNFLKNILEKFAKEQFNGENNYSIAFKKNEEISIKEVEKKIKEKKYIGYDKDREIKEYFKFTKPEILNKQHLENVLFVDDIIDEGNTIGAFLDYLVDNNLIDKETEIFACIIYNIKRPKENQNKAEINRIMNRIRNKSRN